MESEYLLVEKIEQYLEGTLSSSEHAAFEKQIAGDIGLQKEVALQKEIMKGFQHASLKKDVAVAFLKYKKIALLTKLAVIGGSVIVGTGVTVGVVTYVNKNNPVVNNDNTVTTPITQIDSTITNEIENDSIYIDNWDSTSLEPTHTFEDYRKFDHTGNYIVPPTQENNNYTTQNINPVNPNQQTKYTAEQIDSILESKSVPQKTTPVKPTPKSTKDTRLSDLFWKNKETPITWLGLDFTNTKFLGRMDDISDGLEKNNPAVANKFFKEWNNLITTEKRKYSFDDAMYNTHVQYYVDNINKRNDTINAKRMFVLNSANLNHLNISKIQKIVNTYNLEGQQGLGMVFIVESFNKQDTKSAIWVTILDMETKEVLHAEKLIAEPAGPGLRNYWARSIYNTIKEIEGKKFNEWRKKYKQ